MDFINTLTGNLAPYLAWVYTLVNAPLIISIVTLLLIFPGLMILSSRKFKQYQSETNKELTMMREQLYLTTSSTIAMANRVTKVEKSIHSILNKQIDIDNRYPDSQTFNKANELLKFGATSQDLIDDGLNRPEADLLTKLHKSKKISG
jgi:hypothetical protein